MKRFNIVVLVLSGLALFYASSSRLIDPTKSVFLQTFFEHPENSLSVATDLINEIRGVGAVMFLGGVVALLGVIKLDFRQTALVVTTVIFVGVVLGRSVSFFFDGMPPQDLIRVAITEGVLSILNVFCLVKTIRFRFQV